MTYRILDNDIYRDATQEEIEEFEKIQQQEQTEQPKTQLDLIQEEQERQAQAIEELIMMTLGGGE